MGMQEYYDFFSDIKSFNEMKLTLNGKKFEWTERTAKLFDFLVDRFLKQNKSHFGIDASFIGNLLYEVRISIIDYLNLTGTTEKKAISILRKDLETLFNLSLEKKYPFDDFDRVRVCADFAFIDELGVIFTFNPDFAKKILQISELGSEFRHGDFKI